MKIKGILKLFTGPNFLMHKPLPYLAVNTEERFVSGQWHEHLYIQFESEEAYHLYLEERVAKSELHYWRLYKIVEPTPSEEGREDGK